MQGVQGQEQVQVFRRPFPEWRATLDTAWPGQFTGLRLRVHMRRDGRGVPKRQRYFLNDQDLVAQDLPRGDMAWLRSAFGVERYHVLCYIVPRVCWGIEDLAGYEWAIIRQPHIGWQLAHLPSRSVFQPPPPDKSDEQVWGRRLIPPPYSVVLDCFKEADAECALPLLLIQFTGSWRPPEGIRLFSSGQANYIAKVLQTAIANTTGTRSNRTFVPVDLCLLVTVYCFGPYFNLQPPTVLLTTKDRRRLRKQGQKVRRRMRHMLEGQQQEAQVKIPPPIDPPSYFDPPATLWF